MIYHQSPTSAHRPPTDRKLRRSTSAGFRFGPLKSGGLGPHHPWVSPVKMRQAKKYQKFFKKLLPAGNSERNKEIAKFQAFLWYAYNSPACKSVRSFFEIHAHYIVFSRTDGSVALYYPMVGNGECKFSDLQTFACSSEVTPTNEEMARIAIWLPELVEGMHGFGMFHRDLKVENIAWNGKRGCEFDLHVVDWDGAALFGPIKQWQQENLPNLLSDNSNQLRGTGTPMYMPPDVPFNHTDWNSQEQSEKIDWMGVAVCVLLMLVRLCHRTAARQEVEEEELEAQDKLRRFLEEMRSNYQHGLPLTFVELIDRNNFLPAETPETVVMAVFTVVTAPSKSSVDAVVQAVVDWMNLASTTESRPKPKCCRRLLF